MMHKKIALAGPSITQKEIDYAIDAVKNGWYETYDIHIKNLKKHLPIMLDVNMQLQLIAEHMHCIWRQ